MQNVLNGLSVYPNCFQRNYLRDYVLWKPLYFSNTNFADFYFCF